MLNQIKFFKVTELPVNPESNSLYFVQKPSRETELFLTSITGVPYHIYSPVHVGTTPPGDTSKIWIDTSQ